ncbi:hypothetical protein TNCV_507081 [Trichonephila clavipes]|nr:hypothetical protein TNCV_507081 [Trichonephila clavipes]
MFLEQGIGKLRRAVDLAASSPATECKDCRNYRLFVTDKNTGLRFLVDSGADLSIIPVSYNDIIRPSKSPWASPLHLVNKKDGSVRPCGD